MATQLVPENLNINGARLPAAYENACKALTNCASIDECQTWANKAAALASYARQADDDTLQKQATRIQSRAVRRCGELLKEIDGRGGNRSKRDSADTFAPPASNDRDDTKKAGTVPFASPTRTEAAQAAGMSARQQKTAVRIANVPAAHFEAAVESDDPPTVTALADMGRRSTAAADAPVPPGFSAAIQFGGHVRRLAEFAKQHEAAFVGTAVADYNRREMRSHIAQCRRLFDEIAPFIRETRDGL